MTNCVTDLPNREWRLLIGQRRAVELVTIQVA